jgi:RHS repeat-associated protein
VEFAERTHYYDFLSDFFSGDGEAGRGHVSPGSLGSSVGFGGAGYWWDRYLGMYHVRHRVYDPERGRWLQRDPIGYLSGWNLYQYCGGDPINGVDPWGLEPPTTGNWLWGFFSNLGNYGPPAAAGLPPSPRPDRDAPDANSYVNGVLDYVSDGSGRPATYVNMAGNPNAPNEFNGLVHTVVVGGAAVETAIRVVIEPADTALTITEIIEDPTRPINWAGILPFVPGGVTKLTKKLDVTVEFKAASSGGKLVSKQYEELHGFAWVRGPGEVGPPPPRACWAMCSGPLLGVEEGGG